MPENIIMVEEKRSFINKAKEKMEQFRNLYKEKMIDTGKSQKLEQKIENQAKNTKKAIKIVGSLATIALMFCPADGPFGEIATLLATPGLCALVDVAADIKKKSLITGKRGIERHFLKVDGINEQVTGYDLTNGEIVEDFKQFIDSVESFTNRSK